LADSVEKLFEGDFSQSYRGTQTINGLTIVEYGQF